MNTGTRARHLEEVADLLWPEPRRWVVHRNAESNDETPVQRFVIVPSARSPRLVVPAETGIGRAAVRNLHHGARMRDRLRAETLARLLGTALGRRVLRDRLDVYSAEPISRAGGSLQLLLDEITGTATFWAMPVSRARANRKPVLQLLDGEGHAVAFVKVGTNELTRGLVRAEAAALRDIPRRMSQLQAPEVISSTTWRSLDLLVLSPLPLAGAHGEPPRSQVEKSALELAEVAGVHRAPLPETSHWTRLGARLRSATDPRSRELARVWRSLTDRCTNAPLAIGSWHGDWAPWNMAWNGNRLYVWDFERFEREVPLGFDLVHYDLQTRILNPKVRQFDVILDRHRHAPELLQPFGVDAADSSLVFIAYLIEIASRWIADRQDAAGDWSAVLDAIVRAAVRGGDRVIAEHRS
ncbi:MAG: hypothetical protein ACRDO7_14940 [Nocardioidaceae bacterium]